MTPIRFFGPMLPGTAILVGAATLALALTGAPGSARSADPTRTLVIAKAADPQSLDPARTIDNNDWTVTYPLYQRLVRYEVSSDGTGLTSVTGDLAKSWTASADGKTWVFSLSGGNAFSDGTPVDAKAVAYSFNRLFRIGQGPSEAFPGGTRVAATGPMQVTFTLPRPFAPFLYTLANNGAGIVNPAVADAGGPDGTTWLAAHSAGSGAYMLAGWDRGRALTLAPNPHYGGAAPALGCVRIEIIPEASARRLRLEAGDVQIAEGLPIDQLQAVSNEAGIRVERHPSLKVTYLYLNNRKAPLDDVDVRRAISYAVDYTAIIDGVLAGNGKQTRGPIPDGMWGRKTDVLQYRYDPAKARAILAKADPKPREIRFLYSDADPNWEPIAIATQAFLGRIGITVTLEKLADATMRERLDSGDFGIAIGNWSPDFADPYMFTNYWFDSSRHGLSGNRSFYADAHMDDLLARAAASTDRKQRIALYGEVQDIATRDAAYVYLFQKDYRIAMRDAVKGFVFNPMLEDIYNVADMSLSH